MPGTQRQESEGLDAGLKPRGVPVGHSLYCPRVQAEPFTRIIKERLGHLSTMPQTGSVFFFKLVGELVLAFLLLLSKSDSRVP